MIFSRRKTASQQEPQASKQHQGVYITSDNIHELVHRLPNRMGLNLRTGVQKHLIAGHHVSRFRGRGMTFSESRSYQPGDEIRHIDWRVTARTGQTHTKVFEEEKDRPITLFVDQTPSLYMGSQRCFKSYTAAELACLCAFMAKKNGDRFGGLIQGCETQKFIQPKSGQKAWMHFCHELIAANHQWQLEHNTINHWDQSLNRLQNEIKPGGLVVLISDFFQQTPLTQPKFKTSQKRKPTAIDIPIPNEIIDFNQTQQNPFAELAAHSDVLVIGVYDTNEAQAPKLQGQMVYGDENCWYNGENKNNRQVFEQVFNSRFHHIKGLCAALGIGFYTKSTAEDPIEWLKGIFRF